MFDTQQIPSALNMEKSVLSSLIQEPVEVLELAQECGLEEEDFYNPSSRLIYAQIVKMLKTGQEFSLITFTQLAIDGGKVEQMEPKAEFYDTVTKSNSVCQMAVAARHAKTTPPLTNK